MGHLAGGLDGDRQRPAELRRVIALASPENPDEPCQTGQCRGKGHAHAKYDQDKQKTRYDETDINGFHQRVSPSSNPETDLASLAAWVAASSISGTATGVGVPERMASA